MDVLAKDVLRYLVVHFNAMNRPEMSEVLLCYSLKFNSQGEVSVS